MSVKGKTRENKEFKKKTGFFKGEVVAINPSKEQLEKLLETEIEGEVEYTGTEEVEGGETVKKAQIVFWVRNLEEEDGRTVYRPVRFFLKDLDRENSVKPEEEGTKLRKKQYINTVGTTTWADRETNLPEWFKERSYRVAKVGEEELYNFVKAWLNKLDINDAEATLSFDWKKLINGDVRELSGQIKGSYDSSIAPLVIVRRVEKEGEEVKEYEQIYNRNMLPGFAIESLDKKAVNEEFISRAKSTDRKKRNKLQKFVLEVTDSQYGIKDFFTLGKLEDYDPSKNPVASKKVLMDDDTSY